MRTILIQNFRLSLKNNILQTRLIIVIILRVGENKNLILAIIKQESNFNPNAESGVGAKGLMQLMAFNSEAYGVKNPFDIDENINAGVKHIKSYLDKYNGNVEMALMAYNAGPGTMARRGVNSPSDLYKMPEETQNYVPKIMSQIVQKQ